MEIISVSSSTLWDVGETAIDKLLNQQDKGHPDVVQLVSVTENNVFGLSVEGPAASAEPACHRAGRRPPRHALRSEI